MEVTAKNTQSWQHRTCGSPMKSKVQNSAENDNLQIYLPGRWDEHFILALNVREAGATDVAAITAT